MPALIVVPTPVGNLGDMTFRAIEVLRTAEFVLAEDTRVSGNLLRHFEISVPVKAFHKDNEHRVVDKVVEQILEVEGHVALVSDAGTPGISDPGFLLVRACLANAIHVECLPGATALIPALVVSGFPCDRFVFEGFLPHKKGRQTRILSWKDETRTVVFYESPHRLLKCLEQLCEFLGSERPISVSREISKKFEETVRGTTAQVLAHFQQHEPRGEFVVVIGAE